MSSIVNLQYSDLKDYNYTIRIRAADGSPIDDLKEPPAINVKSTETVSVDISRRSDSVFGIPADLPVGALAINKRNRRYNIFLSADVDFSNPNNFTTKVSDPSLIPSPHTIYFKYDVDTLKKYDIYYRTENGVAISVPSVSTRYPILTVTQNRSTLHDGAKIFIPITDDPCQVFSITVDGSDNVTSTLVSSGGGGVCKAQAQ